MNILVYTRQGRRVAQAALELCGSSERRDFATFISSMSLNAELVACRTSMPWKSRQHKRRFRRSRDLRLFGVAANASESKLPGAADRGQYRQAAGAVAQGLKAILLGDRMIDAALSGVSPIEKHELSEIDFEIIDNVFKALLCCNSVPIRS
jgi:hypothetical protein